jgi:hypothetical protein
MTTLIIFFVVFGGSLIFVGYEAYMSWFQPEKYLTRIRKWHEKFPAIFKGMLSEKTSLWYARITMPLAMTFLCCYILTFLLMAINIE